MTSTVVYSNTLNLDSYHLFEGAVFIKDTHGRYLWANSFFINRSAGFGSLGEISNKKDTDFAWHEYAKDLRSHDKAVLSAQSQSHYEQIIRYDGTFVDILSKKNPSY